MAHILAADLGGTTCRFAVFEYRGGRLEMAAHWRLPTAEARSFDALMAALHAGGLPLPPGGADMAALAVAGPVRGQTCDPPNIPWSVDLSRARERYGFARHLLVNDFEAQAWAVRTPAMDDAATVVPGAADPAGAVAVLGPGTGLGMALSAPDGHGGWLALPSEAGHALFPFDGEAEFAFQEFLKRRTGRAQVVGDMVVSGPGLAALHAFHTGRELAPPEVSASLEANPEVLDWAARFWGRACRDAALRTLCTGGVVLSGGVAAKARAVTRHPAFAREFRRSETHGVLLGSISVRLNAREDAGLWGAALAGARELEKTGSA